MQLHIFKKNVVDVVVQDLTSKEHTKAVNLICNAFEPLYVSERRQTPLLHGCDKFKEWRTAGMSSMLVYLSHYWRSKILFNVEKWERKLSAIIWNPNLQLFIYGKYYLTESYSGPTCSKKASNICLVLFFS